MRLSRILFFRPSFRGVGGGYWGGLVLLEQSNYICRMDKLVEIIAKLSLEIGRMEESAKEQFNFNELTLTQMNYLETINNLHNPNLTELASEMNLTKPTVKVAIDKLIEKGFIYRVKSDDDRRSAHLHLTVKGKVINHMHDFAHKQMAELIVGKLDQAEVRLMESLFEKVFQKS
jgi:DNA-binding MarR family transcriptional regulator